jgi:nucleoside 2-deoxyribosyltransferase
MHALRYAGHEPLADELASQGFSLLQARRVTQRELLAFVGRYVHVDTGPQISRPAGYEASRLMVLRDAAGVLAVLGGTDDEGVTAEIGVAAGLGRPVVVLRTDSGQSDNAMLRHIVESTGGGCYWDHLSALAKLHACVRPRRPRPTP